MSTALDYALSMRPEYHQAVLDIIRHYQWDDVIYLYDSEDGQSEDGTTNILFSQIYASRICFVYSS